MRNRDQESDKTLQRAATAFNERQKSVFFDENGQFLDATGRECLCFGHLLLFYKMGWGEPDIFQTFIFAVV
jgi:hypothetical protein